MIFRKNTGSLAQDTKPAERVTSVLGPGITWKGNLRGSGGVRIEGAFEGEITIRGMVVVGETGRITTNELRSNTVIVAGSVRGNILAEKLEIRSTGRVWGDVRVVYFSSEEGAFLRGQVQMEEHIDLQLEPKTEPALSPETPEEPAKNRREINLFKESDL